MNNTILFTFDWLTGSLNDNIIRWLKERNINYRYTLFELEADLRGVGEWVRFDFEKLGANTTAITITQ